MCKWFLEDKKNCKYSFCSNILFKDNSFLWVRNLHVCVQFRFRWVIRCAQNTIKSDSAIGITKQALRIVDLAVSLTPWVKKLLLVNPTLSKLFFVAPVWQGSPTCFLLTTKNVCNFMKVFSLQFEPVSRNFRFFFVIKILKDLSFIWRLKIFICDKKACRLRVIIDTAKLRFP